MGASGTSARVPEANQPRRWCPQVVGHRPAHYFAAVCVENDRQIQPALPGADVRDIAEPLLVRSHGGETPLHQILDLHLRISHCCPTKAPRWAADQAGDAHQASHALRGDALFPSPQVGVDTRRAVGASAPFVNGPDLLRQRGVRQRTTGGMAAPPGLEATGRHLEYATQLSDRILGPCSDSRSPCLAKQRAISVTACTRG
jgi:hypothetical protein